MEKLLRRVYKSPKISLSLKIISHASVAITVLAYAYILVLAYFIAPLLAVKLAVSAAVPFIAVTLIRKLINAPRPYELYSFYEKKPKEKVGQSFPSRHVFSAFLISTLAFPFSLWLTLAVAVVGVSLAVARVLLGMHFWRDVITGSAVGIISGIVGILIIII